MLSLASVIWVAAVAPPPLARSPSPLRLVTPQRFEHRRLVVRRREAVKASPKAKPKTTTADGQAKRKGASGG